MLEVEVEILKAVYQESENPVFLWRAINTCLEAEIEFPKWVRDYLLKSSTKIKEFSRAPAGREKEMLADVMEFKSTGSSNNFTRFYPTLEKYAKVFPVMKLKMESDKTFTDCELEVAAENGTKTAKVKKLSTVREKLQKIPNGLDLG